MHREVHDHTLHPVADDQQYMGLATFKDSNGAVNIQLELELRGDGEPRAQVDADDYIDKVLHVKEEEQAVVVDYRFTGGKNDAEQEIFTRVKHELAEEHGESEFGLSAYVDEHQMEFGFIVEMLGHEAVRTTVFASEDFENAEALESAKLTVWTATVQPLSGVCKSFRKIATDCLLRFVHEHQETLAPPRRLQGLSAEEETEAEMKAREQSSLPPLVVRPHEVAVMQKWVTEGLVVPGQEIVKKRKDGTSIKWRDDLDITPNSMRSVVSQTGWLKSDILAGHVLALRHQLELDGVDDVFLMEPYAWDAFFSTLHTPEQVGSKYGRKINFAKVRLVIFIAHVHGNHWVFYAWNSICESLDLFNSFMCDEHDKVFVTEHVKGFLNGAMGRQEEDHKKANPKDPKPQQKRVTRLLYRNMSNPAQRQWNGYDCGVCSHATNPLHANTPMHATPIYNLPVSQLTSLTCYQFQEVHPRPVCAQVFTAMGVEALARRSVLDYTQSSMVLYRRLMPLQLQAGRMLRAASRGTPACPGMQYSNVNGALKVTPRGTIQCFLRRAARQSSLYEIGGEELKDWQEGMPFMPAQSVIQYRKMFTKMVPGDVEAWLDVVRYRFGRDAAETDLKTVSSWLVTNCTELTKLARRGKSETGMDLFRSLIQVCGASPTWCRPTEVSTFKVTKGRTLLLAVLGALDALSADAMDDRQLPAAANLSTTLSKEDQRVSENWCV